MWVFGYGSLMGDGWEEPLDCEHRGVAILQGYRRVFNKASVRNWGSRACKCLTLNLQQTDGASCTGVAFKFSDARRQTVMEGLEGREGKDFPFVELPIAVQNVGEVLALVPIYLGKNIVADEDVEQAIRTMRFARGESGACIDYVGNIYKVLESIGIEDPAVQDIWRRVSRAD